MSDKHPGISGSELDARLAQLKPDIEPAESLWAAIAENLETPIVGVEPDGVAERPPLDAPVDAPVSKPVGAWREWAVAAAFAAATAAFIAVGTVVPTAGPSLMLSRVVPFESHGQHGGELIRVRQQLHTQLRKALEELSPATRVVVVENLTRIEEARAEIEAALKKEPGNRLLEQLLLKSYTSELTLLKEFASVTRTAQQRTRL